MTTYQEVANEAKTQAVQAVDTFFNDVLKGEDQYACGFAWVTVYPENKGNTKLGKQERRGLESIGFKKDWTGKAGSCGIQVSIEVKTLTPKKKVQKFMLK